MLLKSKNTLLWKSIWSNIVIKYHSAGADITFSIYQTVIHVWKPIKFHISVSGEVPAITPLQFSNFCLNNHALSCLFIYHIILAPAITASDTHPFYILCHHFAWCIGNYLSQADVFCLHGTSLPLIMKMSQTSAEGLSSNSGWAGGTLLSSLN